MTIINNIYLQNILLSPTDKKGAGKTSKAKLGPPATEEQSVSDIDPSQIEQNLKELLPQFKSKISIPKSEKEWHQLLESAYKKAIKWYANEYSRKFDLNPRKQDVSPAKPIVKDMLANMCPFLSEGSLDRLSSYYIQHNIEPLQPPVSGSNYPNASRVGVKALPNCREEIFHEYGHFLDDSICEIEHTEITPQLLDVLSDTYQAYVICTEKNENTPITYKGVTACLMSSNEMKEIASELVKDFPSASDRYKKIVELMRDKGFAYSIQRLYFLTLQTMAEQNGLPKYAYMKQFARFILAFDFGIDLSEKAAIATVNEVFKSGGILPSLPKDKWPPKPSPGDDLVEYSSYGSKYDYDGSPLDVDDNKAVNAAKIFAYVYFSKINNKRELFQCEGKDTNNRLKLGKEYVWSSLSSSEQQNIYDRFVSIFNNKKNNPITSGNLVTEKSAQELAKEEIQRQDGRFRFQDNFPHPLSPKESDCLLEYIKQLPSTMAGVEKSFKDQYGINERFQEVEILIPGHFNDVLSSLHPPKIEYLLGFPDKYKDFFTEAEAIYAHEMGHLISSFLPDGTFRYSDDSNINHAKTDVKYLKESGSVPYKYLRGVDFSLLPVSLIEGNSRFHYLLNELIANRVAEIIVGKKDATARISKQIPEYLRSSESSPSESDPFYLLFYGVMADVCSLYPERDLLLNKLRGTKLPWENYISTEDLKSRMIDFYNKIEIINFKDHAEKPSR